MATPKSLENLACSLSMSVREWEMLFNAAFEYGYCIQDNSIYDVGLLDRVREKAERKLKRVLDRPKYKYRKRAKK